MLLLAASLFFAEPAPLDMPRAEAYLVRESGVRRLEDRFDVMDLWTSQTVDGRWIDTDGRVFTLATLNALVPRPDLGETTKTRSDWMAARLPIARKDVRALRAAIAALSPVELPEKPRPPRQLPRGYRDVDYWQGTNETAIVCAFLLEKEEVWRLAVWSLAESDEFDECLEYFEEQFLEDEFKAFQKARKEEEEKKPREEGRRKEKPSERDLLRADARHSVAAYSNWHVTDAKEFTILDDLPKGSTFVVSLTNDLAVMRRKYAEALPTSIDGKDVLCVARIYGNRDEYLDALETDGITNMNWSAAYWSPQRRELVAYLPEGGEAELKKTIRHEAFHQYLSYATSMISTSPWLNEGYAQYFEEGPDGPKFVDPADCESLSECLPALLAMDYGAFYSGSDLMRRVNYRLALMTVYFLEKGARDVRFDPFKDLKSDYVESLFETRDMRRATIAALKDPDTLKLFVAEWLKFYKKQ